MKLNDQTSEVIDKFIENYDYAIINSEKGKSALSREFVYYNVIRGAILYKINILITIILTDKCYCN